MSRRTPRRDSSSCNASSICAAVTSMNGTVSASSTTARRPWDAARTRSRTVSALAKNRRLSTRSTATWLGTTLSGVSAQVAPLVGGPGDLAQLCDVGPRGAVEQQQQRDTDADEQPRKRVEDQHAGHRGDRGDEVRPCCEREAARTAPAVDVVQVLERSQVDQL